ncbi:MAG: hypothetical protein ACXVNR_04185 [Bacteroidia bacterium]
MALFSCKTGDKFSVHKRKYNPGFYIEKNSKPEDLHVRVNPKKLKNETEKPSQIKTEGSEAVALNKIAEKNQMVVKTVPKKKSFVQVQQTFIEEEKTIASRPVELVRKTDSYRKSTRGGGDFLAGVLVFLAVIIILLGIAMIGAGVYFLVIASTATYSSGITASYGLSLIGYGCLILGVAATLYKLFR